MLAVIPKKIKPESIIFIAIILSLIIPVQLAAAPSFIGNVIGIC